MLIEDYKSLPPNIARLVPEGTAPLEFVTMHSVREYTARQDEGVIISLTYRT